MKVAVASINNYLSKKLTTEQMVAGFNRTEVEVEEIITSPSFDKNLVVVKITALAKHPQADRLSLVTVDDGKTSHKIVCGAPNLEVGQTVVLAKPAAVLPDGVTIKKALIRGVESAGMLCSPAELGLSDDHSGLLLLGSSIAPGTILCDIWPKGDQLDIKTQPNRWDQLSLTGLAREASGYVVDSAQKLLLPSTPEITYKTIEKVNVKKKGECARFVSVKLAVKNDRPSPRWLVDNLERNGLRSINAVVDITNFVMLETGQPSHAYDAHKLNGQMSVRRAYPAEKITTLDGVERSLTADDLVIADDAGVIGLAGVMGTQRTQTSHQTTEIVLEVANFDRQLVRKSALRHGLRSDASARFERSLPLRLPVEALPRLLQLLEETCAARVIDGPFDQLYGWPWIRHIGLRLRRAERVIGMKIDEREVMTGLRRLGFEVEHFSLTKELTKHLGKPYIWGANFKQHGTSGFDCSYLVDYVYSLIGISVGHTALGQFHHGKPVEADDLKPGDVVFIEGVIDKSATDHYYAQDDDGVEQKVTLKRAQKVGHNGIYLGNNKVITASGLIDQSKPGVVEVPVSKFVNDKGFLGARRYVDSFNHILAVTAPWWRTDINLEEDMIEEVIKIIGHDKLPATTPVLPPMPTAAHQILPQLLELKKALVARGLFEVMTYSFISADLISATKAATETHLEILNPLSREQQYLRSSLLPSHLKVVSANQHYSPDFKFFEASRVYHKKAAGKLPSEYWVIGVSVVGPDSLLRLKGEFESIASMYKLAPIYQARTIDFAINGRAGQIKLAGQIVGHFGQISPAILAEQKIDSEMSYGELVIEPLLDSQSDIKAADLLPYSPVVRDLAIELDETVYWQGVKNLVLKQPQVLKANYLSDFQDDKLAKAGRKSLAFRVSLDLGAQPTAELISKKVAGLIGKLQQNMALANIKQR